MSFYQVSVLSCFQPDWYYITAKSGLCQLVANEHSFTHTHTLTHTLTHTHTHTHTHSHTPSHTPSHRGGVNSYIFLLSDFPSYSLHTHTTLYTHTTHTHQLLY